jgi:hypothetical protein
MFPKQKKMNEDDYRRIQFQLSMIKRGVFKLGNEHA